MYNNPYSMGYNPQLSPQQRLSMMEQQYPQFSGMPQQQQPMQMPNASLKGRAVSSFEEARVAMIDFDGSIFIFPDIANKKIYTKQINLDGTATLLTYELSQPIQSNNNSADFVKEIEELKKELSDLQQQFDDFKGGMLNVKSDADIPVIQPAKKQSKSNASNANNARE